GIIFFRCCRQCFPAPAGFSRSMTAAAKEQVASIIPEGQAVFLPVQIHPGKLRGTGKGQHIGPTLIELQKIASMLVEKGEMGGYENFVRKDFPPVRNGAALPELPDRGVFIDRESGGQGKQKLERVKLGLIWKFY